MLVGGMAITIGSCGRRVADGNYQLMQLWFHSCTWISVTLLNQHASHGAWCPFPHLNHFVHIRALDRHTSMTVEHKTDVIPATKSQVWQGVSHVASWRVAQSRDSFSEYSAALFCATLTRVRVARQRRATKSQVRHRSKTYDSSNQQLTSSNMCFQ